MFSGRVSRQNPERRYMNNLIAPSGPFLAKSPGTTSVPMQVADPSQKTDHDFHHQDEEAADFASLMAIPTKTEALKPGFQNTDVETVKQQDQTSETPRTDDAVPQGTQSIADTETISKDGKTLLSTQGSNTEDVKEADAPRTNTTSEQLFSLTAPKQGPSSELPSHRVSNLQYTQKQMPPIESKIGSSHIKLQAALASSGPEFVSATVAEAKAIGWQSNDKLVSLDQTSPTAPKLAAGLPMALDSRSILEPSSQQSLAPSGTGLAKTANPVEQFGTPPKQVIIPVKSDAVLMPPRPSKALIQTGATVATPSAEFNAVTALPAPIAGVTQRGHKDPLNSPLSDGISKAEAGSRSVQPLVTPPVLSSALVRPHSNREPIPTPISELTNQTQIPAGTSVIRPVGNSANVSLNSETIQPLPLQGEALEVLSWESPRPTSVTNTGAPPTRTDFAPQVARQLIDVMPQALHRPVEITLSPDELGRVRMSVQNDDGVITVSIIAERADTLDLMRRHIDQLGQSFRAMGFESISFAFGHGSDPANQENADQSGLKENGGEAIENSATPTDQTEPDIIQLDHASSTGIDIRL